jgi:hypothetical protein
MSKKVYNNAAACFFKDFTYMMLKLSIRRDAYFNSFISYELLLMPEMPFYDIFERVNCYKFKSKISVLFAPLVTVPKINVDFKSSSCNLFLTCRGKNTHCYVHGTI